MSARGRKKAATGEAAEKPPSEFYPTPAWCVTRLLQHVDLPGGHWLEPSAGEGAILRAVASVRDDVAWTAAELRPECEPSLMAAGAWMVEMGDFLRLAAEDTPVMNTHRVALGNPPFSLAAPVVLHALEFADVVIMLLRLNFLGSSSNRRHLFDTAGMPDVYVLPERPSFTGEGTDATEYAWMRWNRDKSQRGEVRILWDKSQRSLFEVG